jgi:hypothetical protein
MTNDDDDRRRRPTTTTTDDDDRRRRPTTTTTTSRWVEEGKDLPELDRNEIAAHLGMGAGGGRGARGYASAGGGGGGVDPSNARVGWYIQQVVASLMKAATHL